MTYNVFSATLNPTQYQSGWAVVQKSVTVGLCYLCNALVYCLSGNCLRLWLDYGMKTLVSHLKGHSGAD